ncbi:unnamed protein product [Lathyrus oleraceus]
MSSLYESTCISQLKERKLVENHFAPNLACPSSLSFTVPSLVVVNNIFPFFSADFHRCLESKPKVLLNCDIKLWRPMLQSVVILQQ